MDAVNSMPTLPRHLVILQSCWKAVPPLYLKLCFFFSFSVGFTQSTTRSVIEAVLGKFKISCRDTNLFELWIEVTTKANGKAVKTILRLDHSARPLELQRCHPSNMSRFMLHMNSEGTLVRVYDHNISPQSNYKSLLVAEETTCREVIDILLCKNRKESDGDYALFLTAPDGEAQIPSEVPLVPIALMCRPYHKNVIWQVDTLSCYKLLDAWIGIALILG